MTGYIHTDDRKQVDSPMSGLVSPVGFGMSHRTPLGNITNSHRLNKSRFGKPSIGFASLKGHNRSKAISIPVLDLPQLLNKPHGLDLGFSSEDYSQIDTNLDDAVNEGSQLSLDPVIVSGTLENTHANSPYLEHPTKNGLKEMRYAVLDRAVQPIDQPCEGLKLDKYIRPRTRAPCLQSLVDDDEVDDQGHIEHSSAFTQALAENASSWPFTHQENNKIIEHWLGGSSSLWNADVRLSASEISPIGDELRLSELEAATQFRELKLPSFEKLISAIERIGRGADNETKEIVVHILRSPEIASKFRELDLLVTIERFDAAINHVEEKWDEETEVPKAYDLARDGVISQPGSVTPWSLDSYVFSGEEMEVPPHLNNPSLPHLYKPAIHRANLITTINSNHDPSDVPTSSTKIHKVQKNVSFAETTTIIGCHPLHSAEIIKEAKIIGHAHSNVVIGVEYIQHHLLDMDIPTRMKIFDRQFSSRVVAENEKREAPSPRQEAPYTFGFEGVMEQARDKSRIEQLHQYSPNQVTSTSAEWKPIAPRNRDTSFGLDGTMDEESDTPFHVSADGFISAPLPSPTTLLLTPIDDALDISM